MRLALTRYAVREIVTFGLVLTAGVVLCFIFCAWLAPVFVLLLAWLLWFFRDPERQCTESENALVSPADGRVLEVIGAHEPKYLHESATKISIFMSLFNVHVNRCPCDGVVEFTEHNPGRFFAASKAEASERNECNLIGIRMKDASERMSAAGAVGEDEAASDMKWKGEPNRRVLVKQIAGLVARRIVCVCRPGDEIGRSQRIGMVKFGSRLEVFVPASLSLDVCVAAGDKVLAGETVLGKFA